LTFVILAAISLLTVALSQPFQETGEPLSPAPPPPLAGDLISARGAPDPGTDGLVDAGGGTGPAPASPAPATAPEAVPLYYLDYSVGAAAMDDLQRVFALGRLLRSAGVAGPTEEFREDFCRVFWLDDCQLALDLAWRDGFDSRTESRAAQLALEILGRGLIDQADLPPGFAGREIEIDRAWTGSSVDLLSSVPDLSSAGALVDSRASLAGPLAGRNYLWLAAVLSKGLLRPNLKLDRAVWQKRLGEAREAGRAAGLAASPAPTAGAADAGVAARTARTPGRYGTARSLRVFSIRHTLGLMVLLLVFLTVSQTLIHIERDNKRVDYREMILTAFLLLWFVVLAWWSGHLARGLLRGIPQLPPRTLFMAMPIPAAAMLGAIFFGARRTVYLCFLGSFLGAIASTQATTLLPFIYICNGCIVSIWGLRHISERSRFIRSAALAGLVNCLTMTALSLTEGGIEARQYGYDLTAAAVSGVLSGILANGLVTLLEVALGLTTNLKLMELGNLNRPLLRSLMLAAPGTYHHSVIVGSMVEAAAEAIGANPHLARVGAYYHDIGKISKPLYFIENQTGENRHETLTPTLSALVLVGHVKEGAELGQKEKLPREVIDIVEQHHGTSLMTYFYHKARENRGPNSGEINEGDFRYPGPKPAGKEAGLVMLADICEAATRSLTEPTPNKIAELVRNLVNRVFDDGQLDCSELVLKDVTETIRVYNNILVGIYHHRVAYPVADKETQSEQAAKSKVIYGQLADEPGGRTAH
jgi:putative nucleotidyltransferase with HDIG domain